jgi:cellulose synthase/poly-beta-1,6-N-acetylglucosamine synthase-like glycosyltransferase
MIGLILDVWTAIYAVCAALLALYALGGCVLLLASLLPSPKAALGHAVADSQSYPVVLVQLPVYNEPRVIERLIDAAARLDYPREALIIQVLDDSTDETSVLAASRGAFWREQGVQIVHVRRTNRADYKAGALAAGLAVVGQAQYAAIFDADFVPPPDFLRRTIPILNAQPDAGALQTRWGHLNADANALTRAQSLALDGHFGVEQWGRAHGGWLSNFSGSGGIWRIAAIRAAGGWSAATLTEDLDLSYRAQLCGWRILYAPDVVVAGEIPTRISAYKVQQARWARGNTRCLIRLLPTLWRAPDVTLMQRLMGTLHLCQYVTAPLMIALLLLTPPLLLTGSLKTIAALGGLSAFGVGTILMPIIGAWRSRPAGDDLRTFARIVVGFPGLVALGTGMAWNNALAVLNEIAGQRIAFQRTPKIGDRREKDKENTENAGDTEKDREKQRDEGGSRAKRATNRRSIAHLSAEIMLMGYALWGLEVALRVSRGFAPYLGLYAAGFAFIVILQLREWRRG